MADVKAFNVLGEIVNIKDSVARNVDISNAKVAILGDSNAYEFGTSDVLTEKYPDMQVDNRAVYGEGFLNGFDRQCHELTTENAPDYILVWAGNNDVRRGTAWGIPNLSVYGQYGSYASNTCFGILNNNLSYLKTTFPAAQIIGVIINKPYDLAWNKWRFFFGTLCEIYKKWNIPILNLNDCIDFSNFTPTQYSMFYKDDLHYNTLGLQRIRDKLCSIMATGCTNTGSIDYTDIYIETSENIESDPAKWIQWAGQYLQPFDSDPGRCSWSGCRSIYNLGTDQRIIAIGTWYGSQSYFRFCGMFRTLTDSTLHYYDTEDTYNNGYMNPQIAVQAGIDVLPMLRKGNSLSISAALYDSCTNLPSGYTTGYTAINIVPAISNTGFLMLYAWTYIGDIWLGNAAAGETTITWKKYSPDYKTDGVLVEFKAQDGVRYNILNELRQHKIFTCTGAQANELTNLPKAGLYAWSIIPTFNSNDYMMCLAIGLKGNLYIGEAYSTDTQVWWREIKSVDI